MKFFVYLELATPNIVAIGDVVHNSANIGSGTINGFDLFHAMQTPDGQIWNAQVNNNGVVTAVNPCP
jgi:hypothetical protein